jgi:hypothetical protein
VQVKLITGENLASAAAGQALSYLSTKKPRELNTLHSDELPPSLVTSDGQLELATRAHPIEILVAFVLDPSDELGGITVRVITESGVLML